MAILAGLAQGLEETIMAQIVGGVGGFAIAITVLSIAACSPPRNRAAEALEEMRAQEAARVERAMTAVCRGEPIANSPAYTRSPGRHPLKRAFYDSFNRFGPTRPDLALIDHPRTYANETRDGDTLPELVLCTRIEYGEVLENCPYARAPTQLPTTDRSIARVESKLVFELRAAATGLLLDVREKANGPPAPCPTSLAVFGGEGEQVYFTGSWAEFTPDLIAWLDSYVMPQSEEATLAR